MAVRSKHKSLLVVLRMSLVVEKKALFDVASVKDVEVGAEAGAEAGAGAVAADGAQLVAGVVGEAVVVAAGVVAAGVVVVGERGVCVLEMQVKAGLVDVSQ